MYNNSHKSKPIRVCEFPPPKETMGNVVMHPIDVIQLSLQSILLPMLLIIILSLSFPVFAASSDEHDTKRVLVVNSYHPGYSWSDDIMKGVRDVLNKEKGVELMIEYLDTKRYITETYFERIKEIYRYKYKNKGVDVVITSDDNALDFMLSIKKELFPKIPLIFCGIDHVVPERIAGHEPLYGVEESDGTRSTLDLILSLHPETKRLVFVSDGTKTGNLMVQNVRNMESYYKNVFTFDYLTDLSADKLQLALKRLPHKSVVLYLSFIRDKMGKVFSVKDSMKLVANSAQVPVYCTWGFQPGTGVMGGNILSGYKQGEVSARIAMQLLRNEAVESIPPFQKAPLENMFDYKVMKRFNIGIKDLPENSVVYNKPFSIYEKYRWYIIGFIIFMVAQTLSVVSLLINQKRRKRVEETLRESEERMRSVLETSPVGISIYDEAGQCFVANDSLAKMIGATKEQVLQQNYNEIESWKISGTLDKAKSAIKENITKRHELAGESAFAQTLHLDCYLVPFSAGRLLFMAHDITERKQAEEAVKESERRLSESQRIAHIGSWELNLITNELYWSDETYRLFGLEPQQFGASYEAFLDNIHPDDRDLVKKAYSDSLKNKTPYQIVHRLLLKDKTVKYVNEMCETYYDDSGEPIRSVGTVQDITERKKAEEKLDQHQKDLEKKVRERTDELQTMVNAMAGREIRMAELKNVIEKLRTQLKETGMTPVADDPLKEVGKDYT